MKTKITKVVALFTTLAIIFSCTEDMEYRDTAVSPVNQLYEPISGKSVELVASATASLFFEWEAAKAEDSGSPLYEIVFEYGFLMKQLSQIKKEHGLMVAQAQYYRNEKIKPMIDEKYGNGTAEFFAQAFEAFYKDK